jgi:hypothetical protein
MVSTPLATRTSTGWRCGWLRNRLVNMRRDHVAKDSRASALRGPAFGRGAVMPGTERAGGALRGSCRRPLSRNVALSSLRRVTHASIVRRDSSRH